MSSDNHVDYIFKLIIIGSSGVGKSQIMQQYTVGKFSLRSKSTIGVDFGHKLTTIEDKKIESQEKYKAVMPKFYHGTHGALLVYSVTDRQSFEEITDWIDEVNKHTNCKSYLLVGNKCDLDLERSVSLEEGQEIAKKFNLNFMETSAKQDKNINEAFELLIRNIYETIDGKSQSCDNEVIANSDTAVPRGIILSAMNHLDQQDSPAKYKCQC